MRHHPIASDSVVAANSPGVGARACDEPGAEFLDEIKAYLNCRSRGAEPPPLLAEAWSGFYEHYTPQIQTFLKRWALSEADRSDCLQDVWHEVVARLARFEHDPHRARLSTWLMALARNKAVDVIRRRHRHMYASLCEQEVVAMPDPGPDPAAEYERRRTLGQVRAALAELSGRVSRTSFQVLYLRWIEGRPTAEVAAALALTPEQVRIRSCRMRRKVRELLERSMTREMRDFNDFRGENKTDFARNGSFRSSE